MKKITIFALLFLLPFVAHANLELNIVNSFEHPTDPMPYLISESPPATVYMYCKNSGQMIAIVSLGSSKRFQLMGISYEASAKMSSDDCNSKIRQVALLASPQNPVALHLSEGRVQFGK